MKTIISASRRTDIPAFYYDWLQEVLKNKKVTMNNPMYPEKSYTIDLSPENVHSIVLWSKNFKNVLENKDFLEAYNLYFQYTITGYSQRMEPLVPTYEESIKTLEGLLKNHSPESFNIRFDPIVFSIEGEKNPTPEDPMLARLVMFEKLLKDLQILGMDKCRLTTSFLSVYSNTAKKIETAGIKYLTENSKTNKKIEFAKRMNEIAQKYNREIYTCADNDFMTYAKNNNLESFKVGHCIDSDILTALYGKCTKANDPSQREACGCVKSRDIGGYFHCKHGCKYCYANSI